jgi:hypothetical protein
MREKGIFRIAVLALVMPLLLGVASADAKKKHKKPKSPPVTVVSATKSTNADGELATMVATCPAGKIAVGGGYISPLLISGTTLTDLYIVYESRRLGDNSWQVSAGREHSGGPTPSLPLTATVDCRSTALTTKKPKKASAAKKKKRKVLRISEVSVAGSPATSGNDSTATASCPAGTQALGGGFSSSPAPDLAGSTSFPVFFASYRSSPATWLSAFLNSGATAHAVTSYAYCAAGLKLKETDATFTVPASSMAGIESKTLPTPSCPKGLALLGGGFNSARPASMGPLPIWTKSGPAGSTWEVGMYNISLVEDSLTSQGICA